MVHLPTVTVVAVTTKDHGTTVAAIKKTLAHIKPAQVILFSDVMMFDADFKCIVIDRFKSVKDYNRFIFKRLGDFIDSGHILVIQHDGYVIDGNAWTNEFLQYDYIGAPWTYTDGRNVGNGGFSLRSAHLHKLLQDDEFEHCEQAEDEKICRYYRETLEKLAIKFAPDAVAHKFSFEMHRPLQPTFGFHNEFHQPYQEPVIIKRSGAMGDVVMAEPILEEFHNKGYRVILSTQPGYRELFSHQRYPVEYLQDLYMEDTSNYRVINLDMAYEVTPKQLALKSYAQICGLIDMKLRNPQLHFAGSLPMFDKYVVLHTDDTAMPHRNVHGVDWNFITIVLERMGFVVIRVGIGNGKGGTKINTYNLQMLTWMIAGAKYFIGIDSGCSQIAVATGVRSMIFFGSVNPEMRYADLSGIYVQQNGCPAHKDGCYHSVVSTVGTECEVDVKQPPCITHETSHIIAKLKSWIK